MSMNFIPVCVHPDKNVAAGPAYIVSVSLATYII